MGKNFEKKSVPSLRFSNKQENYKFNKVFKFCSQKTFAVVVSKI